MHVLATELKNFAGLLSVFFKKLNNKLKLYNSDPNGGWNERVKACDREYPIILLLHTLEICLAASVRPTTVTRIFCSD